MMNEALQKQQRPGQLHNVTWIVLLWFSITVYCGLVSLWFSNMYYCMKPYKMKWQTVLYFP